MIKRCHSLSLSTILLFPARMLACLCVRRLGVEIPFKIGTMIEVPRGALQVGGWESGAGRH